MLQENGFVHRNERRSAGGGRGRLAVDQRVVSGRRRQPAVDLVGQLRGRGHDARRRRDRRDQLQQRAVDAAREGHLPARGRAVSGGAARLRGPQGLRAADRLRLLHRRHHLHEGDAARDVRGRAALDPPDEAAVCGPGRSAGGRGSSGSTRRRDPHPRRGARLVARRRLQEDQVLHERERRLGRAGSARAADAHHRLLADHSAGGDGGAAVRARRSPRRRGGPVVRDAAGGAAAADVRPPGHRRVDRQRRAGRRSGSALGADHACPTSRASSSTTTIPGGIGFSQPLFAMHADLLRAHARR